MRPEPVPGLPASKGEYVLRRLREDITQGVFKPGDPIRQDEVALRLGVSSTPVREALRRLEAEGAVVHLAHRGATVAELNTDDVHQLYLLRERVEGLAARLAAERIDDRTMARLAAQQRKLRAMPKRATSVDRAKLNRELHFLIYEQSGSTVITGNIEMLWAMFPVRTNVRLWEKASNETSFLDEHDEILAALGARDPDRADAAMAAHIRTAYQLRAGL